MEYADHIRSLESYGATLVHGAVLDVLPKLKKEIDEKISARATNRNRKRATNFSPLSNGLISALMSKRSLLKEILDRVGANRLIQSEVNLLRGGSTWHRDGAVVPWIAYRLALYMEPQAKAEGSFLFVPGSHRRQGEWGEESTRALEGLLPDDDKLKTHPWAIELISQPGDAILFHCGVTHASFGTGNRRQAAMVFAGDAVSNEDKSIRTQFMLNRMLIGTQIFN